MNPASKPFLSPAGFNIEGLKFRDVSMGDVDLANAIGVTMLGQSEGADPAAPALPMQKQITRLLWMLNVPDGMDLDAAIDAVLAAVEDGTWEKQATRFAFKLSTSALMQMTDRLQGESAQIEAAAVKVAEEEAAADDGKKKAVSPADSPPSSGPSTAAA